MGRVMLALVLIFAACGDDDSAAPEGDQPSAAADTEADTDDPAHDAAEPGATFSVEQLQGALLTVTDLPEGFAVSPPEDDDEDGGDEYCDDRDPTKTIPAAVEAEVAFQKDMFGPFVGESLSQFTDDDEARRFMDEVRDVLDDCASYQQTDDDGQTSQVTLSKLSFDREGDDTVAMRINVAGGFPFTANLIAVRHGDLVIFVSHAGIGGIDFDLTKTVVATALDEAEPLHG